MTRRGRTWVLLACILLASLPTLARATSEDAGSTQPLDPDEAFVVSANAVDDRTVALRIRAAPGHFLYRERMGVRAPAATLKELELPRGKIKFDPGFDRDVEILRGEVQLRVPVVQATAAFTLVAHWQGCADAGLCYPPAQRSMRVSLRGFGGDGSVRLDAAADHTTAAGAGAAAQASTPDAAAPSASSVDRVLRSGRWPWIVGTFFVMGLLLSFTPCVLPMMPILSSIVVGRATQDSRRVSRLRGLGLAASYSLGMALVYTALGVVAGLAGEGLATYLQQPVVLIGFGLLLTVFALAMFDLFELSLPGAWMNHVSSLAHRLPGGRGAAVFAMGAVSAAIVSPCVSAPLAGALVFIGNSRDVWLGGSALFALAAGMSVPLLLLGASAGAWLPRAGAWMVTVKRFFAWMLLAVALWVAHPALPPFVALLVCGSLLLLAGFMINPFDRAPAATPWLAFRRAAGLSVLVVGALQFVGAFAGASDPLRPLEPLRARGTAAEPSAATALRFQPVARVDELEALVRASGRPAILTFHADWCVSCKEMEHLTFADRQIALRLPRALLLAADVTSNTPDQRGLLKRFGLFGPPSVIFFDAQGRERVDLRTMGFRDAKEFSHLLDQVGL